MGDERKSPPPARTEKGSSSIHGAEPGGQIFQENPNTGTSGSAPIPGIPPPSSPPK